MQKQSLLIQCALVILATLMLLWTVPASAAHHEQAPAAKNVYICGCGPEAKCDAVAGQPGKAPCGKPLIEKQVLKEDADKVYVCACPDGCKCGLNQADPTKCACGKELRAYPKAAQPNCAKGGCDKCAPAAAAGCDKPCCAKPAAK
ncbi:MAG: hypothetical protein FDZ69_05545 [Deltaproteobacteria bacterium]|nr:MAG: hypothetical protein FDZ69_05545 [Deltaproteobacteria bacterium]